MNREVRKLIALLLIGAFAVGASACNTMSGVGKDTQRAGEKIEKEAERGVD
jgi:predicted small secreted protein